MIPRSSSSSLSPKKREKNNSRSVAKRPDQSTILRAFALYARQTLLPIGSSVIRTLSRTVDLVCELRSLYRQLEKRSVTRRTRNLKPLGGRDEKSDRTPSKPAD
jgi:hypothetical protein